MLLKRIKKCWKKFYGVKAKVDKQDISKLVGVPTSLNNLKTKINDLDLYKLKTVPLDLKKVIDVVSKQVVKTQNSIN